MISQLTEIMICLLTIYSLKWFANMDLHEKQLLLLPENEYFWCFDC